ncbi:class I SAM-dependent methyltransferase [Pelagibacterium limicola]|uniref:class I SAM-dependent methyltransferase n=1 Tax=Pelagibacterium limicola TaxID=2791022 RepID=UPI0018AFAA20|nr:class I SAM-dependent methyltransferase [Pelagibacterium limicola]
MYDLIAPRDATMENFYVEVAGGPSRRVLELACGSGRFTVPLAKSGAHVVGGDLSETMLERARSVARETGAKVNFVTLDMRDFQLNQSFDAVVIAANSIMHMHSTEDFARLFATIRRHLAPGGNLVFDVFVPNARLLRLPLGERQLLGSFRHDELGEIVVEETISYNPTTQISEANWYWSTASNPSFRRTSLRLRQIFPQELPLLLRQNGFELVSRFGDFDRRPLTPESWRQVCIAKEGT